MSNAITTFIFLIICYSVSAQVYWNGGSGKWTEASKWSTGQVPTAVDSVVINTEDARVSIANAGFVKIKAMYLGFRSELMIEKDNTLLVTGGNGNAVTSLSGKFYVDGTLQVMNAAKSGMQLNARDQFNLTRLNNNGLVEIAHSGRSGIDAGGAALDNNGTIISERNTLSGISTGHPQGIDFNRGTIICRNNSTGMSVSSSEFINEGPLLISNSDGSGLSVTGSLNNTNVIEISDSDGRGVQVTDAGTIINGSQSILEVRNSLNGALVTNGSTIQNSGKLQITSSTNFGLTLMDSSILKSFGLNEILIDTAQIGISAGDESTIDLLGSDLYVKNCSVNGVQQFGTSLFTLKASSSLSISKTTQSAYQLFDQSTSQFFGGTSLITDMINGSTVFSVNDDATLIMDDGAEMMIGI